MARVCIQKEVLELSVAELLLPEEALGDLKVRMGPV